MKAHKPNQNKKPTKSNIKKKKPSTNQCTNTPRIDQTVWSKNGEGKYDIYIFLQKG